MEEIYWLQRLGNINTLMWVVFVISSIALLISLIFLVLSLDDDLWWDDDKQKRQKKLSVKSAKALIWVVSISCLGGIFVPTTNEMYAIYGIGGTIDYLKENETAKQLPDKVVNALDKWVDGLNEDKENEPTKH